MKFQQALNQLIEDSSKKMTRPSMGSEYITKKNQEQFCLVLHGVSNHNNWGPSIQDVFANDWIVT